MARLIQDMKKRGVSKEDKIINELNLREEHSSPRYKLWFLAFFSCLVLVYAISMIFARASVTVVPKIQELSLNENFSASKNNVMAGLSFDLVVISGEENRSVKGTEISDVAIKAQGEVFVYNNFSTATQILAKDTQLEGSNGKIYRTVKKITVPGMSKTGTPGKIEVGIYGNVAGEAYNSTPLDFKILGFKGTPKYAKFYARSKGDITGGLKGKYYKIPDVEKTKIVDELKKTLSDKLLQKIVNQTPPGFILFKDAFFLNINENNENPTARADVADDMVDISIKGTLHGFIFDEKNLTKKIAGNVVEKYDGSSVHIPDIKNLTFSLSNKNVSFSEVKNIDFNLSGPSKIVWDVDSSKLISSLVGRDKKEFTSILDQYMYIDSANLKISPIWKLSLPNKRENIKVIVNEP